MTAPRRRAVWAYDLEHLLHPFILLGVESLIEAGWDVTVVAADKAEGARWRSLDGFSYARREAAHRRIIVEARGPLAERAQALEQRRQGARSWAERALLRLRISALDGWSAALKAFALARHFTWEKWLIYLRGFLCLARLDADVMIASRPQAGVWACLVARARGMRFVYYPFELYGEQIIPPSKLVAALERLMLRHGVDAVVTQNSHRAAVLRDERGSRVEPLIVHNYKRFAPARRPTGRLRAELGIGPDMRIVLYEGMIVQSRWLEFLAQASLLLPPDVVLVMMGQEKLKWRKLYRKHLKAPVAAGRLIFAPPVPQEELLDYVADADVGVIIYDDSVRNNVFCEPGKLCDYVCAGVPVVAPGFPTIGPVVQERGLGLCFEGHSPEAIAATLIEALGRPKARWRPSLEKARQELTWESQAPNLLAAVAGEAVERPAEAPAPVTAPRRLASTSGAR
jgi:glycosyltransferase involved in cell wall biosynthesis